MQVVAVVALAIRAAKVVQEVLAAVVAGHITSQQLLVQQIPVVVAVVRVRLVLQAAQAAPVSSSSNTR
jgi:hypothetical protein